MRKQRNKKIKINPELINKITNGKFFILRNKYTKKPLALSITKDGFLYCFNKIGKSIAFEDITSSNGKILIKDKTLRKNVIIENYVPNLSPSNKFLKEEILWFNKAKYLL